MPFLSGAATALATVAGLFFLRFFRKAKDPLFLLFGLSFLLMALSRVGQALVREDESDVVVFLPRLAAFLLIIFAIVQKNRGR